MTEWNQVSKREVEQMSRREKSRTDEAGVGGIRLEREKVGLEWSEREKSESEQS
jgi:hypothetical protein